MGQTHGKASHGATRGQHGSWSTVFARRKDGELLRFKPREAQRNIPLFPLTRLFRNSGIARSA